MRRKAWRYVKWLARLVLSLAAVGAGAAVAAAAPAEPLRVCSTVWPPYTTLADDGRSVAGLHSERVTRALQAAGVDIVIEAVSWERCLRDLADGYYAAAYSASFKPERALYAVYPEVALEVVRYVAVVRRGDGAGWDGRHRFELLPQPVGSPRGWAITDALRQEPGLRLDDSSSHNDQDIRKLLAGRIGSAVLEARAAQVLLARHDREHRLEILAEPVEAARRYYMIFGRKALGDAGAERLAQRFAAALAADARAEARR